LLLSHPQIPMNSRQNGLQTIKRRYKADLVRLVNELYRLLRLTSERDGLCVSETDRSPISDHRDPQPSMHKETQSKARLVASLCHFARKGPATPHVSHVFQANDT